MKYQKYFLIFLFPFFHADDLDLGSDFSAGDTVSASAFNSRFNEIEKTIGIVKDSYLIGTWTCTIYNRLQQGSFNLASPDSFLYTMTDTITFSENDSNSSLTHPKSWSSAAAGSFVIDSLGGKFILTGNTLHVSSAPLDGGDDDFDAIRLLINFTSEDQFSLATLQYGGGRFPHDSYTCNKNE
jgi:hypothetical protein